MPSEMEFVNYKQFVEKLPVASSYANGDKSVVSNGTNGPRQMPQTIAEQISAQDIINRNVVPAFSTEKNYTIGDYVVKDGSTYVFVKNHVAGSFDSSEVIQSCILDFIQKWINKIKSLIFSESTDAHDILDFSDEKGNVFSLYDKKGVFRALLVEEFPSDDLLDICDERGFVIAFFDKNGLFHSRLKLSEETTSDDLLDICDERGNTFAFFDKKGNLHNNIIEKISLFLPNKIVSWPGDQLQLFKYPCMMNEYFGAYSVNFYLNTSSNTLRRCGKNLRRYFECCGLPEGEYEIGVDVVDKNMYIIDKRVIQLSVKSPVSPISKKNILLIGDSETQGATNNSGISVENGASEEGDSPYANELQRLLTTSTSPNDFPVGLNLSNIQLIGTQNSSGGRHEGYGGADVSFFLGNNSPFYVNGSLNINAYLSQDIVYDDVNNKGVDLIYILLGANNGVSTFIDENGFISYKSESYRNQIIQLIDTIKAQLVDDVNSNFYNPQLKIVLLSYAFPWIDGYGYHPYGSKDLTDGFLNAKRYVTYKNINDDVASMYGGLVESVMVSQMVDSENGYAYILKKKNAYSEETELTHIEAVHPNRNGYCLYAQAVARDIIGRI